jgi:hypothetical protein
MDAILLLQFSTHLQLCCGQHCATAYALPQSCLAQYLGTNLSGTWPTANPCNQPSLKPREYNCRLLMQLPPSLQAPTTVCPHNPDLGLVQHPVKVRGCLDGHAVHSADDVAQHQPPILVPGSALPIARRHDMILTRRMTPFNEPLGKPRQGRHATHAQYMALNIPLTKNSFACMQAGTPCTCLPPFSWPHNARSQIRHVCRARLQQHSHKREGYQNSLP